MREKRLQRAATQTISHSTRSSGAVLRAAFRRVRARRASEARIQTSFEELIASVRAEDPALAAEEAKKRVALERYESRRAEWLLRLIRRAADLNVDGAAEVVAIETDLSALSNSLLSDGSSSEEIVPRIDDRPRDWDEQMTRAQVEEWRDELISLRTKREQNARMGLVGSSSSSSSGGGGGVSSGGESGEVSATSSADARDAVKEASKHEHYARLLKLPRLIDETLSTWIDPSDDLSDKQIFHELLRMMGLPDTVEPRLMRAMIEAVKQHRLRREREEIEKGDWSDLGPEPIAMRAGWRSAHPATLRKASAMVNHGGDGNDFAMFVATILHSFGARVRLSIGCSNNVTVSRVRYDDPPWVSGAGGPSLVHACQMFAEVRLGRNPAKIATWVRTWLPGSRWLGKAYHYRLDREGYAWLGLDWIDGSRVQRPGAPIKSFDSSMTIYYPDAFEWETEGEVADSAGMPKPKSAPAESVRMGVR